MPDVLFTVDGICSPRTVVCGADSRGPSLVDSGRRSVFRNTSSDGALVTAPQRSRRTWRHGGHLRRVTWRATVNPEN